MVECMHRSVNFLLRPEMEKNGHLQATISLIPSYSLNGMLCGHKSRYWRIGDQVILLPLLKIATHFLYLPATAPLTLYIGAVPTPM